MGFHENIISHLTSDRQTLIFAILPQSFMLKPVRKQYFRMGLKFAFTFDLNFLCGQFIGFCNQRRCVSQQLKFKNNVQVMNFIVNRDVH